MYKRDAEFSVWQWNCRGFTRKRHNLQLLLSTEQKAPLAIALQEPGPKVRLVGYQVFQSPDNPYTAVLVQRNIPGERSQFDSIDIPHDLVVLYPPKRKSSRFYILNVYSSPRAHSHKFKQLFHLAILASQPHSYQEISMPHTWPGVTHRLPARAASYGSSPRLSA